MIIASSQLQMESARVEKTQHVVRESTTSWTGLPPGLREAEQPPAQPDSRRSPFSPAFSVSLSNGNPNRAPFPDLSMGSRQTSTANRSAGITCDPGDDDPKIALIRAVVEAIIGKQIELKIFRPRSPAEQAPVLSAQELDNWGAEIRRFESYSEYEMTTFRASGSILTTDGREITFSLELEMERSFYMESSSTILLGNAAVMQDPLVINFGGTAAQLTNGRFGFDLFADGGVSNIHFATGGSGFLAFDRNGDGIINDGSELFGPKTGNGFLELRALDEDGNGWIDSNDSAWESLHVWSKDEYGNDRLLTMSEAGIGAICLENIATLFSLMDTANQAKGQIQSTGIFIGESGQVGTIQHVDLSIHPDT